MRGYVAEEQLKVSVFNDTLDIAIAQITRRFSGMNEMANRFGFHFLTAPKRYTVSLRPCLSSHALNCSKYVSKKSCSR